jgi:hypothetical protein
MQTKLINLFIYLLIITLAGTNSNASAETLEGQGAIKYNAFYAISKASAMIAPPSGSIVESVSASLIRGAELLAGRRGIVAGEFPNRDRLYWRIIVKVSESSKYHGYSQAVIIDTESGEVLSD